MTVYGCKARSDPTRRPHDQRPGRQRVLSRLDANPHGVGRPRRRRDDGLGYLKVVPPLRIVRASGRRAAWRGDACGPSGQPKRSSCYVQQSSPTPHQ